MGSEPSDPDLDHWWVQKQTPKGTIIHISSDLEQRGSPPEYHVDDSTDGESHHSWFAQRPYGYEEREAIDPNEHPDDGPEYVPRHYSPRPTEESDSVVEVSGPGGTHEYEYECEYGESEEGGESEADEERDEDSEDDTEADAEDDDPERLLQAHDDAKNDFSQWCKKNNYPTPPHIPDPLPGREPSPPPKPEERRPAPAGPVAPEPPRRNIGGFPSEEALMQNSITKAEKLARLMLPNERTDTEKYKKTVRYGVKQFLKSTGVNKKEMFHKYLPQHLKKK
jgi:hypothetical protein